VRDRLQLLADLPLADGKPKAAVLVPLFEDEAGDMRVLLIKRPDTMPTHAGHIAFPGGRPDPGDRDPVHTALREAEEEVGLPQDAVEVIGYLPVVDTVEFPILVHPVVGIFDRNLTLTPSPREVIKMHTPRLIDLAEADRWVFEIWRDRRVWFFDLDGDMLWGATGRMVRRLVGLEPLID
jgi:8-oxo-dGTP pyrophosphatase MutT (NUDIX family)